MRLERFMAGVALERGAGDSINCLCRARLSSELRIGNGNM